ncbi:MAG: TetR family transcriptional regulator [Acidobacteria bacterium]|nr:MAG: TetR family transcriptional regulator [Acidobacteriota bacterium]
MRSDAPTAAPPPQGDARERLVAAATDLFGRHGVRGTTVKMVAEQAGVSPALVIHHFGSKEGLRAACDRRLAEQLRAMKTSAMADSPALYIPRASAGMDDSRPLLRYLARVLVDRSPEVDALVDEIVDDAVVYTQQAEDAGWIVPSADRRARVVVLTLWSLGALVLHEQLDRLLGVDLLDEGGDILPYLQTSVEIFTDGLMTPEAAALLTAPEKGSS